MLPKVTPDLSLKKKAEARIRNASLNQTEPQKKSKLLKENKMTTPDTSSINVPISI